ncbi:Dimethlysulfonioproprionate lyase [Seminavis robusta]|uniref:Dimethlysulfonioproprionate lyase n=1 Tax=Seminavis robusta TaxID=568900 RepID=A0A9N8F2Q5_9STRA|nr:Dimethlysulfonioproprionate lyase [Seminavis robusta]|eukprot:Sro2472_g328650.1 Dimethlysulfonioproprionate lyase (564) ;mRNA; r:4060-5751
MPRRASVVAHHQHSLSLAQTIRSAIHDGAKLFNDGKKKECYELYLATAYGGLSQQTMHAMHAHNRVEGAVETMGHQHDKYTDAQSEKIRELLTKATVDANVVASKEDYGEAAWVIRRAFDLILKMTKRASKASELKPAKTGGETQDDVSFITISDGATEREQAETLSGLCNKMADILDIGNHKYRLTTYPDTFVGKEAVTKLVKTNLCTSREDAVKKLNKLMKYGLIYHVTKEHKFKDEPLFYKLTASTDLRFELDKFGTKTNTLEGEELVHYATLLGRFKSFHKHPSLGVLRLDYDYPPAAGDIDHPDSYDYPVYYRVVPGLTFEMCQSGVLSAEVGAAFDDAVLWLAIHKDVSVISGDCGFMFWFVERCRKIASKKIISLSPLMQLPIMVAACAPKDKILVLTANGKSLDPMHDLIKRQCGIDGQNTQFIIVGCENVPHFGVEVAKGLQVDVDKACPGIVELAKEMVRDHPDTRMILMECTELPPYSDAVREATRLPVWDAITNCNFFMQGFLDSVNFGLNGWYEEWDGIQEEYVLGQNLNDTQRLQCVWCRNNELNYAGK